jgi:hypothetical protein
MNSISNIFSIWAGRLAIIAVVLATGCSSMNRPASVSFAGVLIPNQSRESIKAATVTVFQQNGYQLAPSPSNELAFQREATRREQLDYAGLVGTHDGEQVLIRVQMSIEPDGVGAYWLGCKAYAICNPGQPVFESSTALFGFQGGPYQKLLDNIKDTLQQPRVTGGAN